ncbi:MAG: T9SS type A sorting domain-containing protein [Chitinophagales bacterium]|nr:T9SS type A sorting domain-containing protein [Chitinophagales bacterium]
MRYLILLILLLVSHTKSITAQTIVYHEAVRDQNKNLIPWYNPNHGSSYQFCLNTITDFWKAIPTCCGNQKFYMIDHTWGGSQVQENKVGGDQFAMLISSWALLYAYTGDSFFINDMKYIADTYLQYSLSPDTAVWANLPYPSNYSVPYLPRFDGDYVLGPNFTQPDKAGSFGAELITLYKITGEQKYLDAAQKIAVTLAKNVSTGDSIHSPFPFKVNAINGSLPGNYNTYPGLYLCANLAPTLTLFNELKKLSLGSVQQDSASQKIKRWVKKYPLQNNNWGNFFENILFTSNASINAITMANYILEEENNWSSTWQQDARTILDNGMQLLGSTAYDSLGVKPILEQTADLKEGGSHTARFGSVELLYAEKTGDNSRIEHAVRQLDWATYLVDFDGKVRFSPRNNSIWYTDGYGDFVRHYIRAMGWYPAIAFDSANHLIRSSSVVQNIAYGSDKIVYKTYDTDAQETFRLTQKPIQVKANGVLLNEVNTPTANAWWWQASALGGVLKINHTSAQNVAVVFNTTAINETIELNEINVYPNPTNSTITIKASRTENIHFSILNNLGVIQPIFFIKKGDNLFEADIANLPQGVYHLVVEQAQNKQVKQVVKF